MEKFEERDERQVWAISGIALAIGFLIGSGKSEKSGKSGWEWVLRSGRSFAQSIGTLTLNVLVEAARRKRDEAFSRGA